MTMPTLAEICDAVATTLSSATGLTRAQSYDEITETIPETPLLQVYPEEGEPDLQSYGSYRVERVVVHADLYPRPRSNIADDMAKVTTMTEALLVLLRAQKPTTGNTLFDVSFIVKFGWSWRRVIFEREKGELKHIGTRFVFTFWVRG
jgi:hypothetical protein